MAFSRDGQGLHRAVDPADGEHYVYGHLFLDAAPSVFACFDQPDLKAPYAVSVTAPEAWQVIGNGAATQVRPGRWQLATTQPLATYFVTVCAGPYASVRSEHDGIPLGIHARASLREPLERQAEQMLEVTRASFDYYHRLFGIRYPFGEYHQVFVPEFNAGAMENPGCVTFRDTYVFRGAAARDEVLDQVQHHRPRDGAHVVRRPRDHAVVGRPVAQRVLRRVHGAPDHGRRHGVHRGVGGRRRSRARCGGMPRSAPPRPTPWPAERRSTRRPRCRTSTASRTPRAPRRCASSSPTSATRPSSPAWARTCASTPTATAPWATSWGSWSAHRARTSASGARPGCSPRASTSSLPTRARASWPERSRRRSPRTGRTPSTSPGSPGPRRSSAWRPPWSANAPWSPLSRRRRAPGSSCPTPPT